MWGFGVAFKLSLCVLQVYGLLVRPGQHATPLRQLWHELADRGEGLRSHWCTCPALQMLRTALPLLWGTC
jgi:hypothetical protein